MIAQLTGEVARKDGRGIVLDVHGVGYRVHIIKEHLEKLKIGAKISLLGFGR